MFKQSFEKLHTNLKIKVIFEYLKIKVVNVVWLKEDII